MKPKKAVAALLLMIGFWTLAAGEAAGETAWYYCTVRMAGPGGAGTFVQLSDVRTTPAFSNKWFELPSNRAKEMLAVALTAMANGQQVAVLVDPDLGVTPVVSNFYLYQP